MEEKRIIKREKVGKYLLSITHFKENYYGRRFVEVRKSNKIIFTGDVKVEGRFSEVEAQYKNLIEEYKLKAIEEGNYTFTRKDFVLKPKTANGYIMQRINKYTNEVAEKEAKITTFEGFIRAFIHDKLGGKTTCGNYKIEDERLIYQDVGNEDSKDTLVLKLTNGNFLGNASKLQYCGWNRKGDEAPAQRVMFEMNIPLVPFNVFEEANLDIQTCKVIEQGEEEDFILPLLEWNEHQAQLMPVKIYLEGQSIKEPKTNGKMEVLFKKFQKELIYKATRTKKGHRHLDGWEYRYLDKTKLAKRHFVGAMLIKVKNKCFLFDVDRKEIPHYRFNPFLVELPKPCKTIKKAYEMLKPLEVKRGEKRGLGILRQGEWFFIPTKKKITGEVKPVPKDILAGLENKPSLREYNLNDNYLYEGRIADEEDVESLYRSVKAKYRTHVKQSIEDYNKAVRRYLRFVKKKEDFEEKFNFFRWGGELRAGENRPNRVDKLFIEDGVSYVKGEVTHTGREHEPIVLEDWHKAIPNTAIKSFTITGSID